MARLSAAAGGTRTRVEDADDEADREVRDGGGVRVAGPRTPAMVASAIVADGQGEAHQARQQKIASLNNAGAIGNSLAGAATARIAV